MKKIKATLLTENDISRKLVRLSHEIIEMYKSLSNIAIVGIRTRGEVLANRIVKNIFDISGIEVKNFHNQRCNFLSR